MLVILDFVLLYNASIYRFTNLEKMIYIAQFQDISIKVPNIFRFL